MTKVETIIVNVAKANNIKIDISKKNADMKSFGIDSLAAMNLIMQVEEKVGFQLEDEQLMKIKTLSDLIKAFTK